MKAATAKKDKRTFTVYCDDCESFFTTTARRSEWTKCPHCKLQFQVTNIYRKVQ